MRKFLTVIFLLLSTYGIASAQIGNEMENEAVMIGDIDMEKVIIHVYLDTADTKPFKELHIVTDKATGKNKVVTSEIGGKISEGGFIIINGLKSKEELVEGEAVYDEFVVQDFYYFEQYEALISDYLRNSVITQITPENIAAHEASMNEVVANKPKEEILHKYTDHDFSYSKKYKKQMEAESYYDKKNARKKSKVYTDYKQEL